MAKQTMVGEEMHSKAKLSQNALKTWPQAPVLLLPGWVTGLTLFPSVKRELQFICALEIPTEEVVSS